jgi:ABC-type nitrate/sulfonate/bicarbonate transport system substrate-binding protein
MSQGPVVVANRDIDIGECTGISTMVSAWNKGAKGLVVFSVGAIQPVYQIVVHPSIKSLQDLKGKHIGSPGPQTASTEAVEMVLKRGFGLLPSRDYDFVATGGGAARAAALVAGKIHAIPTFPPLSDDLEQRGMRVLGDMVDYVPLYVSGVDVVRKDWAEQNRDLMVRLIKAIVETGQWLKAPENKGAAIDWFAKNIKATEGKAIGEASATKMYDYYIATKKLSFDGYAPEQAVRSNLDILKERGLITDAEIPPLGQLFDFSYLNQALRELNLPQVAEYPK